MKLILNKRLLLLFIVLTGISCNSITETVDISGSDDAWSPGSEWVLVWSDEFDKQRINYRNWSFQVEQPGRFNNEWQAYVHSTENCFIQMKNGSDDGVMIIKVIQTGEELAMGNFTSARMITFGKQSWKYGKIAARIKLPYGQGLWPAFWMMGTNCDENRGGDTPWPECGEIDIIELIGGHPYFDSMVHATLHYDDNGYRRTNTKKYLLPEGKFADDYHVFEIEWDSSKIVWKVDGNEYNTEDITSPGMEEFHKEFYIILNVAVGGNWPGYPNKTTVFPQYMMIDWVRVYQRR
jgi:beta-glucanase (GH16 family)